MTCKLLPNNKTSREVVADEPLLGKIIPPAPISSAKTMDNAGASRFFEVLTSAKLMEETSKANPSRSIKFLEASGRDGLAFFDDSLELSAEAGIKTNRLFIRDVGAKYFEQVLHRFNKPSRSLLVGTPGIGKSYYGQYLCWEAFARFVTKGHFLIYHKSQRPPNTGDRFFLVDQHGAYETQSPRAVQEWVDSKRDKTIYIADGIQPMSLACRVTALITSPDPNVWKGFQKYNVLMPKSFPVLTDAEMEDFQQVCASERTSCNKTAGNVLRAAFLGDPKDVQAIIKSKIRGVTTGSLVESLRLLAENDGVHREYHTLFHIATVDGDFHVTSIKCASDEVEGALFIKLDDWDATERAAYLRQFEGTPALASARGWLFESHTRDWLRYGGTFRTIQLRDLRKKDRGDPVDGFLTLPKHEIIRFGPLATWRWTASLPAKSSASPLLFAPTHSTFTALDYFSSTGRGFNAKLIAASDNFNRFAPKTLGDGKVEGLAAADCIIEHWPSQLSQIPKTIAEAQAFAKTGKRHIKELYFCRSPDLMEAEGFTPRKVAGEGSERYADIQQFFVEIPLTKPGTS
jgi:hypothetical protein